MARKMKDSGIEWIGEIPEGWELINAKYLFSQRNEKGNPTLVLLSPTQKYGVIPQSQLEGVVQVKESTDLRSFKTIHIGDFVISLRSFQGGFEFSNYEGVCSPAYQVFHATKDLSNDFFRYLFKSDGFISKINSLTVGIREGKNIQYGDFSNMLLAVPPKEVQIRSAQYLNAKCTEIDTMLSKTRSSIEEYKKLKQAVITQAVTKGVRGEREMKDSGVEWIGETPAEWRISRIKYVSIFEPSCDFRKLTPETIITYSPMECIKNGTFERRTSLYGNLAHTLTPFQNGDIVMAKVTPCFENGNIAIMNDLQSGYGLGSSELFVFRPQNINTRYLFYWLQNKLFVHQACATMTGTGGLKRISPSFVKNCNIHYPPAAEQEEIADYLDAKCAEIDKLIAKKEQLVKELESYKKSLIYEVVTGKREV